MKHVVAYDDDGHFVVVQLTDRKKLWELLKYDVCDGDAWANRDGDIPVDNADDFNALSEQLLLDVINEVRYQGAHLDVIEIETNPVITQAVDKVAPPALVDDTETKRRQWRKTTLAFAMAYPDWFGPENGMIGSDIVENALHVLDLLPDNWVKHIVSINPNPSLKVEIQFERPGGVATMLVSRAGILYHVDANGRVFDGGGHCDKDGVNEFDRTWTQTISSN